MLTVSDVPAVLAIGLGSGIVGGLLGFGGSVLMIPLLTSVLDRGQHLAQASAMIVNAVIAAPALWRHHRAGAVRWPLVWRMLPFAIVAILLGVEVGNRMESDVLRRLFGAFLVYVVVFDIGKIIWRHVRPPKPHPPHAPSSVWRAGSVGGTVGTARGHPRHRRGAGRGTDAAMGVSPIAAPGDRGEHGADVSDVIDRRGAQEPHAGRRL